MNDSVHLIDYPIIHAGIKPVYHERLATMIDGQSTIRYMRFLRRVKVERLELGRTCYARHEPFVPTHPAHVIVSVLDASNHWRTVREVEIPPNPRIAGKGISQDTPREQIDRHFAAIVAEPPFVIELGGLETDHLRVECDREHPVWPNHGEISAGGIHCVNFGILDPLKAFGRELEAGPAIPPYAPPLQLTECTPTAPAGMEVQNRPDMLLFSGRQLSVGFSLKRPVIPHLGFDELGEDLAKRNRLLFSRTVDRWRGSAQLGLSGPLLRTLRFDAGENLWTGEVRVRGNTIAYKNLRCIDGLSIDATFTVEPDRVVLELTQTNARQLPYLEAEAWRLAWNIETGITGCFGKPTRAPGRNGDVELPALWATDAVGCLGCKVIAGDRANVRLQVESYRTLRTVTGGIVLGERKNPDQCQTIPAGRINATLEFRVTNLEPNRRTTLPVGIRRSWATIFAGFRPETRTYGIHPLSTGGFGSPFQLELATITKRHPDGPDPVELARLTVERVVMDGPGYGYHRNLYPQADPCILSAIGRVYQVDPQPAWLRRIAPGIVETVERILANVGDGGLLVCRDLSGNSGSYRWSDNELDTVGFGHIDALVNAWAYRAFRNGTVLLKEIGRKDLAERCRDAAVGIKKTFSKTLINPKTGWVAGWKSRDGQLHDYAFLYVNGPAIAFGLLEDEPARLALRNLEKLRREVGMTNAGMGLPFNLIPLDRSDHMLPKIWFGIQPTYEFYTDGALNGWTPLYYLRALSRYGFNEEARKMATELDEGYALGLFRGGDGSGVEWRTWAGCPTGYEGTSALCHTSLYSVAIELGQAVPPDPEWWPAE